jgi:hypothetical protein
MGVLDSSICDTKAQTKATQIGEGKGELVVFTFLNKGITLILSLFVLLQFQSSLL